ncbi:MAG: hypothetical protein WCG47_28320 [Dermatophilaceae bacterium]
MINVVRSEVTRLTRRGLVIGWLSLTAVFAVLINVVMFQVVSGAPTPPANGPGVSFPTEAQLLSDHGIVAGLAAASSLFGVVTLAFWAIATATDYNTGLVRLLVAAHPIRWQLIIGKWFALAIFTAAATAVALAANLIAAPVAAQAADYSPTAWGTNLVPTLAAAAFNLFCALLVWGTIGLALASLTRSAGIAIGVGIGYVLLLESIIKAAASVGDWLPGTTITALANGGTPHLAYPGALALGLTYLGIALIAATVVFTRRDITD